MIGENLKELRKKHNLSMRILAEKAKISKSTISDIENNKISPTADTLGRIASALNVPVEDFFKYDYLETKPNAEKIMERYEETDKVFKDIVEALKTATPEQKKKILDIIGIIKEE